MLKTLDNLSRIDHGTSFDQSFLLPPCADSDRFEGAVNAIECIPGHGTVGGDCQAACPAEEHSGRNRNRGSTASQGRHEKSGSGPMCDLCRYAGSTRRHRCDGSDTADDFVVEFVVETGSKRNEEASQRF
jgi:hypothetical protein